MHLRLRREPAAANSLRRRLLTVLAVLLVVAVGGVFGIGWYFSGVAIAVGDDRPELNATVVGGPAGGGSIQLSPNADTELPGQYGLEWTGGDGQVGAITATTAVAVTRGFTPLHGSPGAGVAVGVDRYYYRGDPHSALGMAFQQVSVHSEVGDLPSWYLPASMSSSSPLSGSVAGGGAASGTWVVFVHGHDSSRQESLRYLRFLHARGLPVLVPSYRNDVDAPASRDHHSHLGDTEWRDVEAAVRWALGHGARDVVLFGWSMGAAVSLQVVDRSPVRDAVRALVLDSPVLDWRGVLDYQGDLRGLPRPLTGLAIRLIQARLGVDLNRFDWVARAGSLSRPMFIVGSSSDTYVPNGPGRALARARPDLVTYLDVPGADHTRGWNVDPERYQNALGRWLTAEQI
jgi:dienelactone hydrolase